MSKVYNAELFAARLKDCMIEKEDTTYSLAKYLSMSASTISKYTTAVSAPNTAVLEKIALRYDVNPVWLMGCETVEKRLSSASAPTKRIPILGAIAAGKPIHAQEDVLGYEYIDLDYKADFCLKVKGDSMLNARILDGDIVYIRQQSDVDSGDIAAVLIDNEATLKRVYKLVDGIMLHPENPIYKDIIITGKQAKNVTILGKCIAAKIWFEQEVK